MDHFNATVHNGALVSSRKGLYISKSKHQGTRFVNAFASDPTPSAAAATASSSSASASASTSTTASTSTALNPTVPSSSSLNVDPTPPSLAAAAPTDHTIDPIDIDIDPALFLPNFEGDDENFASFIMAKTMSDRRSTFFDIAMTPPPAPSSSTTPTPTSHKNITSPNRRHDEPFTPLSAISGEHDDDGKQARALYASPSLGNNSPRPTNVQAPQGMDNVPSLTQRIANQYITNVPPQSPIFDAIATVASLTTGAAHGRDVPSAELGASIARVCAAMNRNLLEEDKDGQRTLPAVLESLAAMALDGIFRGQQQHWHILMRGLQHIHDRIGGLNPEWGSSVNKIRKADVKGAVYAGTAPYLAFDKFFPSVSDNLPLQQRAEITSRMRNCLQDCRISPTNIDSLQALSLFAQTVAQARQASATNTGFMLDPNGYAEDYLRVEYQIVRYPRSLREDVTQSDGLFSTLGIPEMDLRMSNDGTGKQHEMSSEHTDPEQNLLNSILRVTALLYIEDILPDAHSIDLYAILLRVLIHQTSNIILAIRHRQRTSSTDHSINRILPGTEAMRPVLLWSCMIGYSLTQFVSRARATSLDKSPFEHLVGLLLLNSNSEGGNGGGLSEADMALCGLLPIRELRAVSSDEGTILRQMVAAYEGKQIWSRR